FFQAISHLRATTKKALSARVHGQKADKKTRIIRSAHSKQFFSSRASYARALSVLLECYSALCVGLSEFLQIAVRLYGTALQFPGTWTAFLAGARTMIAQRIRPLPRHTALH